MTIAYNQCLSRGITDRPCPLLNLTAAALATFLREGHELWSWFIVERVLQNVG